MHDFLIMQYPVATEREPEEILLAAGTGRKPGYRFIGLWITRSEREAIDRAVQHLDTDRSKFIRRAIRREVRSTSAA